MVVIDELDRCRPSYAAELLEIAKHLFAVDQVVFVLAVNRDQLAIPSVHSTALNSMVRGICAGSSTSISDPAIGHHLSGSRFHSCSTTISVEHRIDRGETRIADKAVVYAFFATSDVSLRTINQAIHHLGLVLATLRPDGGSWVLCSRADSRTHRPGLAYREFMSGQTEDAAVSTKDSSQGRPLMGPARTPAAHYSKPCS